jgi:hypothetical protein
MNTNGNGNLTISDVYLIYKRINNVMWPVTNYRIFNSVEWNVINVSMNNLVSTYPGTQTITLTNPTAGGSASYYLVRTGYRN